MACSCNSNSNASPVSHAQGCSGGLPLPRRTATPPTVPVEIRDLGKARQALSGKIVLSGCGDEVQHLESAIDGLVAFDAATGKATVVPGDSATMVQDNFPCSDEGIPGLFLMAKDPGCRDFGENPDREIVVARPSASSQGIMIGFQPTCPASLGAGSEMVPVKLTPGELPGVLPAGLKTLVLREVISGGCTPAGTHEFYLSDQPLPIPASQLEEFALPNRDLVVGDNKAFGLAVWVETTQGMVLQKVTNESLQAVFGKNNVNTVSYLTPASQIYDQTVSAPSLLNPGSSVTDLAAQPNYFADAKEVGLQIEVSLAKNTGAYSIEIFMNGARNFLAYSDGDSASFESSEVTVPIPADKKLNITINRLISVSGSAANTSYAKVWLKYFR